MYFSHISSCENTLPLRTYSSTLIPYNYYFYWKLETDYDGTALNFILTLIQAEVTEKPSKMKWKEKLLRKHKYIFCGLAHTVHCTLHTKGFAVLLFCHCTLK